MTPAARRSIVALVYPAAAVLLTWPLASRLTSAIAALQGPGDPFLNLWILGWGLRAWTTRPWSIVDGSVFDANIFHPAVGTLTYSDHFLLQALALAPVYALSHNAVLCYNLLVLVSIAASGLAMHALTRAVTGSTAAALVAGIAWACWPYRTAHLLHIQLQALYFMPLALWALHRVVARRRWRDAVLLGVLTALQAIASVYYGVMTAAAIAVAGVTLAVATGQWRSRRLIARAMAAAAIGVVLVLPVLVPYARSQQSEGFGRTLFEASNHSASWRSYVQVPPANLVWGRTGILTPAVPAAPGVRDRSGVEDQLFPGLIAIVLSIVGVVRYRRSDARPLVLSGLALVGAGLVLSFGPEGVRGLYAALHDHVFGFQAIRAPARFAVVAALGLFLLAGLGTRAVSDAWGRRGSAAAAIVAALLVADYVNAPLPLAAAPPLQTATGQWLARDATPGPVLYLPIGGDIENTPFMVQSLEHGRPIVNGYSGQRPAFFNTVVEELASLPSATAFAMLRELDVRFVVSPQPIAGAGGDPSPLVERARLADNVIYEVRWSPAALAGLEDHGGIVPPPAGDLPFRSGETAVYSVHWDGGPLDLPAGTATLTATGEAAGWRFDVRADTADWVAPFFQAHDRFVTEAGADLLPAAHTREIREGRRELTRVYLFDRDARHVRVGATRDAALQRDALTLPLGNVAARDAVAALYYVRTLPLQSGTTVDVPLNEAGTSMTLQIATGEVESIALGGATMSALRLEPRVMRRLERRRPLAMTVWLSRDARRIPLRILVDAGFGRVRAELTNYR